jgi:hypothetical protein
MTPEIPDPNPPISEPAVGFSDLLARVRLLYNHEAANEMQVLARTDPQGAYELAAAALHPKALEMKHRIDASERKNKAS